MGIGNYPYTTLTCTQEFSNNYKHIFEYRFKGDILQTINKTIMIPAKKIDNIEKYEKEFNQINDIKGCSGSFTKKVDLSGNTNYTTNTSCILNEMSDADIKTVSKNDKDLLFQTKEEIIKKSKDSTPTIKCRKENF